MKIRFNLQYPHKERSLIMAIIRGGGQQIKKSTGITIPTSVWDKTKQRCDENAEGTVKFKRGLKKINKQLNEIDNRWSQMGNFWLTGSSSLLEIDLSSIFENGVKSAKKEVEEEEAKLNRTPTQFFQEYVDRMPTMMSKDKKHYISKKTQNHHRTVLERIKKFLKDTKTEDSFEIFDKHFEDRFTNWANKTALSGRGYALNTLSATYSILKIWLNAAKEEGLIKTDYFHKFPTKDEDADAIYLTTDEITAIYKLDIPSLMEQNVIDQKSTIEITRDLFIIGCWTGLREADLNRINEAVFNFKNNTLTLQTQKTKAVVTIPLHPYVRELYEKYNGQFPHLIDRGKANAQLKELGRLAGITEPVTISSTRAGVCQSHKMLRYQCMGFHTARRSFATNLYKMEAPTISIMQMTGHKSEANFLKYIKVSKEEHAEMMQKFFNKTAV